MNKIDRSKRIGPELGQIESANSKFEDANSKLLTEILNLGLNILAILREACRRGNNWGNVYSGSCKQGKPNDCIGKGWSCCSYSGQEDDIAARERLAAVRESARSIQEARNGALLDLFGMVPEKPDRDPDLQALLESDGEDKPGQKRKMRLH